MMKKISVVLPLFNGKKYIDESINSILDQTYTEWEFIIVNDYGSDDGCADIVRQYAKKDGRIKLIQAETRLGLAESLNVGIKAATGDYIARVDVDDPSYPDRFQIQVEYMEQNPDVALCGTIQRSVLPNRNKIEEVPCEKEELKAALLFGCEISHCSVMFRRKLFLEKGWFYNPDYLGEDFELWTRIMFKANLVNIPEVLVDHRWGFDNISIEKGESLRQEVREVNARTLGKLGIEIPEEDLFLLSGWRNMPQESAQSDIALFLQKNYELLELIENRNKELNLIDEKALQKILFKRWNWGCQTCGIFFRKLEYEEILHDEVEPRVSLVMTVYNNVYTVRETIESILSQDYEEWEFIIVCEYGNNDGSNELVKYYAKLDKRIKAIESQEYLGVAGSLNLAVSVAKGEYIARIDAFDLSNQQRLAEQVSYMDEHDSVGITQFYQHFFGDKNRNFTKRPPITCEELKARVLFFNAVCASTLMYRRKLLEDNGIRYREFFNYEDYDLVLQLMNVTSFETIPEVYGEYRVNKRNNQNSSRLQGDEFIQRQLDEKFCLLVSRRDLEFINPSVPYYSIPDIALRDAKLRKTQYLLWKIYNRNVRYRRFDEQELLKVIASVWRLKKYGKENANRKDASIYDALETSKIKLKHPYLVSVWKKLQGYKYRSEGMVIEHQNIGLQNEVQALEKRISKQLDYQFGKIDKQIERWTWKRYTRMERQIAVLQQQNASIQNMLANIQFERNVVPYYEGEKIRIVFLFQIASFWGAWESLYQSCKADRRVDAKLVFLNETNREKTQMTNAKSFLQVNELEYMEYDDFEIENFNPHILIIQTPYDEWHRKEAHWSSHFRMLGYRLVYIPYGIEISDTEDSHLLHFCTSVIQNCWRIYTFSNEMKKDYWRYSSNRKAVRALGLPRFDYFYRNRQGVLPDEIEQRRNGRKVVLWKVHFPKIIIENGRAVTVTPELDEYIEFASVIKEFSEFFFIFMPHPKFYEKNGNIEVEEKIEQITELLLESENVWIDEQEDYRNSIICSDFVIIDRSAVMVEAGALNIPVLYVSNADYDEPMTKAIKALMNSYYHANNCQGMLKFLLMCKEESDPKAAIRERAFQECIPFFDGMAGERIKEDIIRGVINNEN